MNKEEAKQFQDLKKEVEALKSEVEGLREFVKALYSMMDEGESYEQSEGLPAGFDFGRINT
ncbi:MAG: hypothetical protein MJZ21_04755 [archaeon]|nr:hypothetical protein [archaeon]